MSKRKDIRFIPVSQIDIGRKGFSINKQTLDLAIKLTTGKITPLSLPPVRVDFKKHGRYSLADGRHRLTAFKLCGFANVKAHIRYHTYLKKRRKHENHE